MKTIEDSHQSKRWVFPNVNEGVVLSQGLTKRELFAAMFMQSLLNNPERYKYIADKVANGMTQEEASLKKAHKAVLLADALITELNKEES